jgi:membrane protease YdiL (CAAX protease family)
MDVSVIILAVFVLSYIGAMIYIANLDDLARFAPKPASNSSKMFGSQELATQQRSTILRWMQYGVIAINLVFALLILQLSLLGSTPETQAEIQQLELALPEVDQGAAVTSFVVALLVGIVSFRVVASETARQRIRQFIGLKGIYNPDSSVHTVAIVLALLFVSFNLSQFVIAGGLEGLAESVEVGGVSLEAELFSAALMTAIAFLGIGMAIRREAFQSLTRLGLRLPTTQDVIWGVGVGVGLYGLLIVLAIIWSALVPAEQIEQQSAAAEQIARSFNTIPLAFALSLAAAVSEEILFRGALQPVFGLIPTSLFFALVHIQYTLTPATIIIFIVGLGLGLLRQRQSTTAAIIAHFVYNFVQLSLAILAASALGANS